MTIYYKILNEFPNSELSLAIVDCSRVFGHLDTDLFAKLIG